ncbi:MAG: GTP 3',8-cyclase MoaA [Planctomycetota bacterium]
MPRPPLSYLRVSVTSRCNLRCLHCQPGCGGEGEDVLTKDEIVRFVRVAVACGIDKVRLTGGEPLVRADIVEMVRQLAGLAGLEHLGLTTNGCLLPEKAQALRRAGLRRVNIGLSALDPDVYDRMTRSARSRRALNGLQAALDAGFRPVKVNVVVLRGVNDREIPALARLSADPRIEVRFIEYMPFGADAVLRDRYLVPAREVLDRLREMGDVEPLPDARGPASAARYRIRGYGGTVGIIAPHSEPFCGACNRIRLTADGKLRACLIDGGERDILPLLRAGIDHATMERLLAEAAARKPAVHSGAFCGQMHRIGG